MGVDSTPMEDSLAAGGYGITFEGREVTVRLLFEMRADVAVRDRGLRRRFFYRAWPRCASRPRARLSIS